MNRIQNIFGHSSNRRKSDSGSGSGSGSSSSPKADKPKPRLDRLNAMKNINYEYSPSSASASSSSSSSHHPSEESLRTRSLDLYGGKTSFRIEGIDGEIEIICKTLGFAGIDDLSISPEEYEAMKVRSSSSAPVNFTETVEPLVDREMEVNNDSAVEFSDSFNRKIADNSRNYERSHEYGGICRNRADAFGGRIGDSVRPSDVIPSVRSNELRGNGIKGVRPPVLAPPPSMSLPQIDKECSTWDMFRAFGPEGGTSISRFERGLGEEDNEGDRRRRGMGREENCGLSGSCSFTSNDDDSSDTTTEPLSSVSPNGRFRRVITEWQKGELLGRGSFGSVYEGIADGGFFFAAKEVSLLDQGEEGRQSIIQLEQEIDLLSQFEHENIVQYYGTQRDATHLYIFLELITKGSLLSLYQKYTLRDSQVSAYTRQILHGLKYLHERNVVHRDIKCANILVDTNGLVKLADFGLAKATKLNDVKSCKGTVFWMAPEVVRSLGYGLAADIWSLGCTVLEMLTGRFPYSNLECASALYRIGNGERPEIPGSISRDARNFIVKCLQVNPSLRPTAAQLLDHPFVKRPLPSSSGFTSPHYFPRQQNF
ncbi:hypothetical protein ABFS83_03G111900 [Erythranthe nasuta]